MMVLVTQPHEMPRILTRVIWKSSKVIIPFIEPSEPSPRFDSVPVFAVKALIWIFPAVKG
jgi:hypothetical protein